MEHSSFTQIAVFLAAAAFAAPLARRFGIGGALGYLLAGMLIGPFGIGLIYSLYEVGTILNVAEFGVVLLLFIIGLELRPRRLWAMRHAVFGLGGAQVLVTTLVLVLVWLWFGLVFPQALFIGLALSLSSTAFALQVLEEKGELRNRHGRIAFSILLFQDLAAIPIIAFVPLFAAHGPSADQIITYGAFKALALIFLLVLAGHFLVDRIYRLVAHTGMREATTAAALLIVVCSTLLMEEAGLSAGLGAFIAGALLADSEFRHQIQADIEPFSGLLLGLFFIAVGMSLDLGLLWQQPGEIALDVLALVLIKAAILYGVGRFHGLDTAAARRLALVISQGGEFAFVLFAAGAGQKVITAPLADLLSVVVTLSMITTPLLLLADDMLRRRAREKEPDFDALPEEEGHVVIAGFGPYGQVIARILRARHIPFTALDSSVTLVNLVAQFHNKIYYGDTTRPAILAAAQTGKARAFVLAIDDVEASLQTAKIVRKTYPHVPIYARAHDRQHVYRLRDLGVTYIERETFASALASAEKLLQGLGNSPHEARRIVTLFKEHDERRLSEDYNHFTDLEKMRARALRQAEELEELFDKDPRELEQEKAPTR